MTTLLIDGDLLIYKAASAVERAEKWDDENWVLSSNIEEAKDVFLGSLIKLWDEFGVDSRVCFAFTKGRNFRYDLSPTYKSNRKDTRKPMCLVELREYVEDNYACVSNPKLEADDILGLWATSGKIKDAIIVSEDKDLRTIPGKLYRQGELETITEDQADYYWMYQTLVGDTADGYSGCPGYGPKTAEKLLQAIFDGEGGLPWLWNEVKKAYKAKGLTEDDALLQARLARILRASDWNSETKEVILWTP